MFIEIIGKIIDNLYSMCGNIILVAAIFALIALILAFPMIKTSINNTIVSIYLKKDVNVIKDKYRNDSEKRYKEIINLASEHGYSMIAQTFVSIIEIVFGILFSRGFLYSAILSKYNIAGIDLSTSAFEILKSDNEHISYILIAILLTAGIQFVRDFFMEKTLLVNGRPLDYLCLVIYVLCAVFMPSGFILYWFMFELVEFVIFEYMAVLTLDKNFEVYSKNQKKKR